ncbi:MAG: ABC transporter permease [Polyangiaceae bacterium]|nr:ABC transporter permease [Polyangiaceae bacterium]
MAFVPVGYNVRSLLARRGTTVATALGVGLVVFVFSAVTMLSDGIRKTLGSSGSPANVIVLRKGSQVELQSGITDEDARVILDDEGLSRTETGAALAAGELVMVMTLPIQGGGMSNLTVRGVRDESFRLRENVRIVEGRRFQPGTDEVIVGRATTERFEGTAIGRRVKVRAGREVTIVGVFEAKGAGVESELWGDVDVLRAMFGRSGVYSSITGRMRDEGALTALEARLEADPRLKVDVFRETQYHEDQSDGLAKFIKILGMMVAIFFSAGAMVGAMITMYAQVAQRKREIGVLRALGFRRRVILLSFLLESILLCVAGGAVGAAASNLLGMAKFSTTNFNTFAEVVFRFEPSTSAMVGAMVFATLMGLVGGLPPALQAARVSPSVAMRE